jgi:hypothetical protein
MELFLEKPLEPVAISWFHHVDVAGLFTAVTMPSLLPGQGSYRNWPCGRGCVASVKETAVVGAVISASVL